SLNSLAIRPAGIFRAHKTAVVLYLYFLTILNESTGSMPVLIFSIGNSAFWICFVCRRFEQSIISRILVPDNAAIFEFGFGTLVLASVNDLPDGAGSIIYR